MRGIALAVIVISLLPLCFIRPWIGALVWTWLGFMNPQKLSWGIVQFIPFAEIVAILTLTGLFLTRERRSVPWNRELVLMAILLCYVTFTTFLAWAPDSAWAYWDRVAKIISMVFVTTMLIYGKERIRWLLMVTALSIGFYGFKGGIFTLLTGGHYRVEGPYGTMISGNTFLGLAMNMVLPVLIFLAREENRKWLRNLLYLTAALTFVAIPFTYSRGALLGLAVSLPFLLLKSGKKILLVLLLAPVLLFTAKEFVPEKWYRHTETIETYQEDISAMQRIRAWIVSWRIAKEHPLWGAGFEFQDYPDTGRWFSYVPPEYLQYGPKVHVAHSIYFQMLGEHGFLAFGFYMAMLLLALWDFQRLKKKTRDHPDTRWIASYATGMQIGLISYMVSGAFLNSAFFDLMFLYVAFTAILRREALALETGANQSSPSPLPVPSDFGKIAAARSSARSAHGL